MTENTLQAMAVLKWIYTGGFIWLYGSGGISGKWKRRFIGAIYLVAGVVGFSVWTGTFHWWYLSYLSVIGAMHLGYGGDTVPVKLRKRLLYGLAMAVSSVGIFIQPYYDPSTPFMAWTAFLFHAILCVFASVFLGVLNPVKNARNEESLIAGLSAVVPLFIA